MAGEPDRQDNGDLQRVLDAVEQRNTVTSGLARVVERLIPEVDGLRRDIKDRPTKAETNLRRRRFAAVLLLFGLLFVQGHEFELQHCSPGTQSARIIKQIASAPDDQLTPRFVKRVASQDQPTPACDAAFPIVSHDFNGAHTVIFGLTGWNLIGLGGYGLIGVMLFLWCRDRRPRR